jgi:hypothetical protein
MDLPPGLDIDHELSKDQPKKWLKLNISSKEQRNTIIVIVMTASATDGFLTQGSQIELQ